MPFRQVSLLYMLCFTICITGCHRKVSMKNMYNENTLEDDLATLEKDQKADVTDLKLLAVFILYKKILDDKIDHKTYADLLLEAKATERKKIKPFQIIFSRLEKLPYNEVLANALTITEGDSSLYNKRKELQQLDENFLRERNKILKEMETHKKNQSNTRREFSNNLEEDDLSILNKASEKTRKALEVALVKKEVAKKTESYIDIEYTFTITNKTPKKIRALMGKVDILDKNIDNLTSIEVECNQEIEVAKTIRWKYQVRYPILSETYQKLKNMPSPKAIWNPQKIFFSDDTIWQ